LGYNTPALVQQTTNSGTSVSSVAITFTNALTNGNTGVVSVALPIAASVSSISGGGTWVSGTAKNATNVRIEQWYCVDITTPDTVVTVSLSGTTTAAVRGTEWLNVGGLSSVTTNTSSGSTSFVLSGGDNYGLSVWDGAWTPTTANANSINVGTLLTSVAASTTVKLVGGYRAGQTINDSSTITASASITDGATAALSLYPYNSIQKFYLHAVNSPVIGTLPPAGASGSSSTPTKIGTGGDTNRLMNGEIGVLQTSVVLTTNASTSAQSGLIGRWISPPLAAGNILVSSATSPIRRISGSHSNSNSNLLFTQDIYVWRPSSGTRVGELYLQGSANSGVSSVTSTSETDYSLTLTLGSGFGQAVLDNDVLVLEIWRSSNAQSMATAYSNTVFYDGATEGSASDAASYLLFVQGIPLLGDSARRVDQHQPMIQLIPQ
jgi:hypothetical protein